MSLLKPSWMQRHKTLISPQTLLDSLDEAVLVIDQQEIILQANRRWLELSDGDSSIGKPLHLYLHPRDHGLWREQLDQLRKGERPVPVWLRLLSDSDLHWCELRTQPVNRDLTWPVSLTLCDITPQVRRDQQRDADHRSLSQLMANLPVMLYRARNNRNWSMEYVSEGCLEVTGYSADALVNQPRLSYGALIHPEDAGPVWDQVQEALHRRESFDLHYRIHHADGSERNVTEKGQGVYAESGTVLGVEGVIFAVDIPEAPSTQAPSWVEADLPARLQDEVKGQV
ncbi:PAS domain-containing protein [Marinobacterium lutimaris]|uniref:histidine kinase n=1 Tax=Marinobacterium lutimaris TaxID=568106 RepID=A0A1H6B6F6_9GAMM|nr:PAS domain-containing protein [Marinobacterium lutimaris]SEG56114.1 PAS domain S-box-containing protein [Marinobacterium lutimaris]